MCLSRRGRRKRTFVRPALTGTDTGVIIGSEKLFLYRKHRRNHHAEIFPEAARAVRSGGPCGCNAPEMELGRKYLSETNYAEAIAAFTEAIKLNPDDIEAYMARAEAYAALKKYDEANADYTAVIEMTEEQPYQQASAYVGRAGVGEETGRLADAESDYTAALALLGE